MSSNALVKQHQDCKKPITAEQHGRDMEEFEGWPVVGTDTIALAN